MGWANNSWSTGYNKNIPISKSLILFLVLIITIGILSLFNYTTGSYVKTLESNKTDFENQLKSCNNQTQCLSSNLTACNTNLVTCSNQLSTKAISLVNCENEKNSASDSLSDCNNHLSSCESSMDAYGSDLDACSNDLDSCNNAKTTLRDNYARDYCCLLNKTHYSISSNRITCGDSGTSISC
jgi:DNA repair ATPase RecN